jgi:hypothetical protein
MRILLPLLVAAALALPAFAQTTTAKSTHTRLTLTEHFEQANTTHDGHLTLDQAQAGYKSVARHFDAIDQDKKGNIPRTTSAPQQDATRCTISQPRRTRAERLTLCLTKSDAGWLQGGPVACTGDRGGAPSGFRPVEACQPKAAAARSGR